MESQQISDQAGKAVDSTRDIAKTALGDVKGNASKATEKSKELLDKAFNKDSMGGKIVQIIFGLLLGWFTLWIGNRVIKKDEANTDPNAFDGKKKEFMILDGSSSAGELRVISLNTILPFSPNYLSLPFSSNIKGGAQYSYSFWIHMPSATAASLVNLPILLRGDSRKYKYERTDNDSRETITFNDYVTMSPMISFGKEKLDFVVDFNTTNNIKETMYVTRIESDDSVFRQNLLSVLETNWIMLTFTFEDNIPLNDFENGIRVCMYVNDLLYSTQMFDGSLKLSSGNLYFFPEMAPDGVKLSTIRYFNHAIGIDDVKKIYSKQPNTRAASISKQIYKSMNVSDGNILDYYNT
jgi:hypothetical protein